MTKFVVSKENNKVSKVPDSDPLSEIPDPPSDAAVKGGSVEYYYEDRDGTGKAFWPPRPTTAEAKRKLLVKAQGDWNMSRSEIRSIMQKYMIYEFVDGNNYSEAKREVDDAYNADYINSTQRDWIHDMLNGAI